MVLFTWYLKQKNTQYLIKKHSGHYYYFLFEEERHENVMDDVTTSIILKTEMKAFVMSTFDLVKKIKCAQYLCEYFEKQILGLVSDLNSFLCIS